MISWYKKKSIISKIKDAYFKSFNIKKYWANLKIDKIDEDLKKLVNYYLNSKSIKLSSKYWNKLFINHINQINKSGIESSHMAISNRYFTWKLITDEFIEVLFNFSTANPLKSIDTQTILKKHDGFTIAQSINYNLIIILLYQYLLKNNQLEQIEILEKNNFIIEKYPSILINNLTLTQDKLQSLLEYNQIKKIIKDKNLKLNFLEIGAGSGRTTETIIRLDERVKKYVIADLPPALYINFLRINNTFKNLKKKICIDIETKEDFKKIIKENDILFILPHQLEYFENKFFDISIAIDCLHEMEKKTIKQYMEIFNKKSKHLYFKVWEETYVPHDFNNYLNAHNEKDYFIKNNWKEIFKKKCISPSNYMELAYETKYEADE